MGKDYDMQQLIKSAMASKAAPIVHAVIAEEVIRLGVGRQEYRKVVVPLFEKIRDAIGWVDSKGACFCPTWYLMKELVQAELKKGPNKATHTLKPSWRSGETGCVWTQVDEYIAERLIAWRAELPDIYRQHLKTICRRIEQVEEACPGAYYMHVLCY